MGIKPKIPQSKNDDLTFVKKALEENDQKAFAHLMDKYWNTLYYVILKMVKTPEDAEDLAIETFHKAFLNLNKYSPNFAFSTWLFKIGTNSTIDFLRKSKLSTIPININDEQEESKREINNLQIDRSNPEEKFIKKQRVSVIKKAVEEMNPLFGILIQMRYFNELSYDEISKALGMPLGTVKVQLHRAKKNLYELLKNGEGTI
ncbi:MAG: sigma-70 family RNA polymerase sigma factor [Bacteroidetes bacterium]|nr:sigma-70 family RNA polymerase sigma factor [Bacteroidota bacterium]MBK7505033.1 sigma-70 family RNA polymerase sigma factor [Bacteroidota bacterium]MBK7639188.1 sigma-70 family RNA polymerase sigma factor [Bacteroidota bacterium]MBK8672982.1 sigma-70 family RNA polymerase sigma factor [Bacteroidota bacterium]MBP7257234.1 sigma-70 family RNA polymerase sigma factor [Chitinophagales bacterium]